ncbi:hypothetical protein MMC12_007507, partial [Toensbergia leucococca]|nr:hypothetical protein [Toensbergia leucococca]
MSSLFFASGIPSPVPPVRSSEALESNHVSPTSTTQPSTITPAAFTQSAISESLSRSLTDPILHRERAPQLSERESIFATHYVITNSSANSPYLLPTLKGHNGLDATSKDDAATTNYARPGLPQTSTSASAPQKAQPSPSVAPAEAFNLDLPSGITTNRQVWRHKKENSYPLGTHGILATLESGVAYRANSSSSTILPALLSQSSRSKSQGTFNYTQMSAKLDQEARGTQNGVHTGGPGLGAQEEASAVRKRNRSSSRVEKRIEATLTDAEPASNARSRKTSHFLGLFKENTSALEQRKGPERPSVGSGGTVHDILAKEPRQADRKSEYTRLEDHGKPVVPVEDIAPTPIRDAVPKLPGSQEKLSASERSGNLVKPHATTQVASNALRRHSLDHFHSHVDDKTSTPTATGTGDEILPTGDTYQHGLPYRLFEETRNHQIEATQSPMKQRPGHSKRVEFEPDIGNKDGVHSYSDLKSGGDDQQDTTRSLGTATEIEEDESDKEQISSAMYYPHQTPSPEALDGVDSIGAVDR